MKNLLSLISSIFFVFLFSRLNSQIKIFDEDCFKISTEQNEIIYGTSNYFIISNNTNKNYLINISGFSGRSLIYRNGDQLLPYLPGLSGYPADWTDEECKENILLISKREKRKSILYLDIIHGYYNVNNQDEYEIDFETEHTKQSPYYYGCKKYVDSLLNQGYEIYNGTLKGKLRLIPSK